MAEYQAVRRHHSLLEICQTPQLAAEVTITAAEKLDVDAAARGVETRTEVVALVRDRRQLLPQQRVGALDLLVPQQQALHPVGEFFDLGHGAPAKGGVAEL